MADDSAALIKEMGDEKADVMFSAVCG